MKTAFLFFFFALVTTRSAELVGVAWPYASARSEGIMFHVLHRTSTNTAWRTIGMLPATEVAERSGAMNGYEVAVRLPDGKHSFTIIAVRAGRPSMPNAEVSCIVPDAVVVPQEPTIVELPKVLSIIGPDGERYYRLAPKP